MKLQEITIKNFRSIAKETMTFENRCQILIGKNEAGKSNFLKAIAALFGGYKSTESDIRKGSDKAVVSGIIEFDDCDFELLTSRLPQNINFKNDETINDFIKHFYTEFEFKLEIPPNNIKIVHLKTGEHNFELIAPFPGQNISKIVELLKFPESVNEFSNSFFC